MYKEFPEKMKEKNAEIIMPWKNKLEEIEPVLSNVYDKADPEPRQIKKLEGGHFVNRFEVPPGYLSRDCVQIWNGNGNYKKGDLLLMHEGGKEHAMMIVDEIAENMAIFKPWTRPSEPYRLGRVMVNGEEVPKSILGFNPNGDLVIVEPKDGENNKKWKKFSAFLKEVQEDECPNSDNTHYEVDFNSDILDAESAYEAAEKFSVPGCVDHEISIKKTPGMELGDVVLLGLTDGKREMVVVRMENEWAYLSESGSPEKSEQKVYKERFLGNYSGGKYEILRRAGAPYHVGDMVEMEYNSGLKKLMVVDSDDGGVFRFKVQK